MGVAGSISLWPVARLEMNNWQQGWRRTIGSKVGDEQLFVSIGLVVRPNERLGLCEDRAYFAGCVHLLD